MPSATSIAVHAAALLLTLCLAAWLTPRAWWRRPNLRALAVLAGGTALLGGLLGMVLGPERSEHGTLARATAPVPASAGSAGNTMAPVAGARYRVREHLNLRTGTGVGARRLAVVPAGTQVVATGRRQGDWWQLRVELGGQRLEGWASSLWLRRGDEQLARF